MSQKNRKICMAALAVIIMSFLLTGCMNKAKIGYIDISRVGTESPQLMAINKSFEDEYAPLAAQMEDISKQQGTLTEEQYRDQVMQIQRKAQGLQRKYIGQRQELMNKVLAPIVKEKELSAVTVKAVTGVDPLAPAENAVNIDGVVVQGGIDITDEVIAKLQ